MNSTADDRLKPLSADLHIHSALSPCAENKMTPDEVIKKIFSLGIDVFSITDHNSGYNCAAFDAEAKEKDILFIPGIELQSSEEIHLLGYFPSIQTLESFCESVVKPGFMQVMKNDPSRLGNQIKIDVSGEVVGEEEAMLSMPVNLTIDKLVDLIHDFNGIAVAAHVDRGFSVISHLGYIPPEIKFDAIEIRDPQNIDDFRQRFFKDTDLNIISSSDSHYIDMMRPPTMKLWLKELDVENCLNCIRGEGQGKITISHKARRASERADMSSHRVEETAKKDWKELYK